MENEDIILMARRNYCDHKNLAFSLIIDVLQSQQSEINVLKEQLARKLKVYGGLINRSEIGIFNGNHHPQVRAIVASTTKKGALEIIQKYSRCETMHSFSNYWCKTGNAEELRIATANPGRLFYNPDHTSRGVIDAYFPAECELTQEELELAVKDKKYLSKLSNEKFEEYGCNINEESKDTK